MLMFCVGPHTSERIKWSLLQLRFCRWEMEVGGVSLFDKLHIIGLFGHWILVGQTLFVSTTSLDALRSWRGRTTCSSMKHPWWVNRTCIPWSTIWPNDTNKMGEVVAMTSDGTNRTHCISKKVDVDLAMGNQRIEVAKDTSKIMIMDDNFMKGE